MIIKYVGYMQTTKQNSFSALLLSMGHLTVDNGIYPRLQFATRSHSHTPTLSDSVGPSVPGNY